MSVTKRKNETPTESGVKTKKFKKEKSESGPKNTKADVIKRKNETPKENGIKTKKLKNKNSETGPSNQVKDEVVKKGVKSTKLGAKAKFEKGNFDKQKKNVADKPPNWNEFKKQKKALKIKRKQTKSLYDISVKAKQIGEKLRQKHLEGGKTERDQLVVKLHKMLGGKGNYVQLVLSHDMGRVVQQLFKFGNQDIRDDIAKELIPSTVLLIQSKYGKFCIKTLLKYGISRMRADVLKACYGNAVKLTSHSVSAHVFEYAYSNYAHPTEKQHLIQEFFGDIYKKSKDDKVKHLRDVYKDSPDMKKAALECTKANLQRVLNKKLLDSGLVQSVLFQYLSECSETDRSELLSQIAPHVVVLSNSKDGSKVVMMCIWNGTNKDRKVAMKALKEHVIDLCKHQHGHTAIIALLDSVDDTVLLNKMILMDILSKPLDLAKSEWGRKVLLWLVAPASPEHFSRIFTAELEKGRENSTCKKSSEVRRKEILNYCNSILMVNVSTDTKAWFENASVSVVTLAIIKSGSTDQLKKVFEGIAKLVVDPNWTVLEDNKSILGIEHAGLHMILKKLFQYDKILAEKDSVTFSEILCDLLDDETLDIWTKLNRGCFVLVAMLENGEEAVQNKLKSSLSSYTKILKDQKHAGSDVLLKKLK